MATFTLDLDDETRQKLAAAAKRIGLTPERLAEVTLASLLLNGDDLRRSERKAVGLSEPTRAWTGETQETGVKDDQLASSVDYAGPFVDLDEALDVFSTELNRRRRSSTG
ncbi:MAG TPA: hypothetical protein VGB60_12520 [Brevundimonas sp.]|jgi:predicted transcriptional regulator|uniref:hypothetical protein n=1 Tax=Brevundimonas sp. TaxID=1871086 RepID=UPI002ED82CD2